MCRNPGGAQVTSICRAVTLPAPQEPRRPLALRPIELRPPSRPDPPAPGHRPGQHGPIHPEEVETFEKHPPSLIPAQYWTPSRDEPAGPQVPPGLSIGERTGRIELAKIDRRSGPCGRWRCRAEARQRPPCPGSVFCIRRKPDPRIRHGTQINKTRLLPELSNRQW